MPLGHNITTRGRMAITTQRSRAPFPRRCYRRSRSLAVQIHGLGLGLALGCQRADGHPTSPSLMRQQRPCYRARLTILEGVRVSVPTRCRHRRSKRRVGRGQAVSAASEISRCKRCLLQGLPRKRRGEAGQMGVRAVLAAGPTFRLALRDGSLLAVFCRAAGAGHYVGRSVGPLPLESGRKHMVSFRRAAALHEDGQRQGRGETPTTIAPAMLFTRAAPCCRARRQVRQATGRGAPGPRTLASFP